MVGFGFHAEEQCTARRFMDIAMLSGVMELSRTSEISCSSVISMQLL